MSSRSRPRKPQRNPSHIVFPKKGAPFRVVEDLPRDQEGLELVVARKFVGAIRHFEGIELDQLARGEEPADLQCRARDGETVHMQIVEVIDQNLRALNNMRSSYRNALITELGEDLRRFSGCRVHLVDVGDPPYLPSVSSGRGRECVRHLAAHLRSLAADIHTLPPKRIRSRQTETVQPARVVAVIVERFVAAGARVPWDFDWVGGGPSYRTDLPRGLLPSAVRIKLAKQYAKPTSGKFWLVAYSVDSLLHSDDPDIAESHRVLATSNHAFDEVWFLYLYADRELGSLVRVWPRTSTR